MGRFMLKQLHIKQWRINPCTRCKVMFYFGLILETLWNNCENNSWHKASSLWCSSRQLRPLQASRGPQLWQKTECQQLLWWLFQGLTGCMTQIRTEKIIASNGYTSLVNGMLKKEHKQKTESVILLAAARFFFWIPTGGWNYYWEPQWHIWLIIIKHSHPPQHDAATLLCLMKINNAVVWSAMISH